MFFGKETETLEFKKTTGEMKAAMVSISSILNKHGVGTLWFGVKPDGTVCGQAVSEASLRDVSRVVFESIHPQIYPVITEEKIEGAHLIKVEFSGNNPPYSAYGRYYLRTADEDREVSPEELKKFFVANELKEKWEKAPSAVMVKNVDKGAVRNFFDKAVNAGRMPHSRFTTPMVLNKCGLADGDHLTNAGELLFGNTHPVTLKAAVFATEEKLTFLDMKLYEDNIYNLLKVAEEYIFKNIRWRAEITGMEREEIPEIPIAVIREVLANSFAHADYNGNTNHEICIHPGMITIYNPGVYASEYSPEEYIRGNHESCIRNETISRVLYLCKTIEQFGSGFKRINSLCKDAHVKYSYEFGKSGFKFILFRQKNANVTVNVSANVTVNKTEQTVLTLLLSNPGYTRNQLAQETSKTVRTIQRTLDSLRDKGLIERVGSDKNGYWKVIGQL
ncbi:MAG: putative DNA binding domain-containing protein [Clostridiales bacterium]|nr:putative DNA binding domain-containing protein [Clostridiales bacterium]